jgi:hypothetical protein
MSRIAYDNRDHRHTASHRYRPLKNRHGYDYEAAMAHERDTLVRFSLQPGDHVLYDFGAGEVIPLTIQSVAPHRIIAVDSHDRPYSFGGVDAPCPGKWDADPVTVTTRLTKVKVQCGDAGTNCSGGCL